MKKVKAIENLMAGILNHYCECLTDIKYKYDPAVGRDKELEKLMLTILTPQKSALLIGKAGVGKTSIIEGLAYRISKKEVPKSLKEFSIYRTSAAILVSGCIYSGMLEKRIIEIFESLKDKRNVILFIDEIHTLIGTGKNNEHKTLDIANIIKPYITNEEIYLVGATTDYEYECFIQVDPAFARRFSNIIIKEPNDLVLEEILLHTLYKYSQMYKIKIDQSLAKDISRSLVKYTSKTNRIDLEDESISNPDLAISIISNAYGYARLYDKKFITFNDFIYSYRMCDKLNGKLKLYNLKNNKAKRSNVIQFKHNMHK